MQHAVDEQTIIYAVRYCLGRQSYAAGDGANLVLDYGASLSESARKTLARDLREHVKQDHIRLREPRDITARWQQALEHLERLG